MYKSLFIPFSTNGDQTSALAFAAAVADSFGAQGEAVFASKALSLLDEDQRKQVQVSMTKTGYAATQQMIEELYRQQFQKKAAKMKEWFESGKKDLPGGGHLAWKDAPDLFGDAVDQVRAACTLHDMTITSFDLGASAHDVVITGALFATGKPLVLIRHFAAKQKLDDLFVMVAWKPSPQAVRALWYALPLLQKAGRVCIASVEESHTKMAPSAIQVAGYLAKHGVRATAHISEPGVDAALDLEEYYQAEGANLLVMGAYSHWRLSEAVMGGFTRYFLDAGTCNLLLAH